MRFPPAPPSGPIPTLVRWLSRRSLRWFYREICFVGREHIPAMGPVLLIGNHPNDLPDVLVGFFTTDRSVRYVATISATTLPLASATYRGLGVIPVMRVRDVRKMRERGVDVASVNAFAFAAVQQALGTGQVVGIFPEGGVHDGPRLSQPRSGVAQMALDGLNNGVIDDLSIVPFGVQYDSGQKARTDAVVEIGPPLSLKDWTVNAGVDDVSGRSVRLSARLFEMLHSVSRNNDSWDDALRRDRLVAAVAAVTSANDRDVLRAATRIQHRCAELAAMIALEEEVESPAVQCRTTGLRLSDAAVRAGGIGTSPRDVARTLAAAGFTEQSGAPLAAAVWPSRGGIALRAAPAVVGLVLHLPLWTLVRAVARRLTVVRTDYAAKAILPGLHLIFVGYLVLAGLFALSLHAAGRSIWWAAVLLILLPRLGDLALSWSDAVRAVRLCARVRRWTPAERAELVDAAEQLRRAWSALT